LNRSNHIVLITPGFPTDEDDTVCIPLLQAYVRALAQRDEVSITILSLQYPPASTPYTWHGLSVLPCGGDNRSGLRRLGIWARAVRTLRQLHRRQPIHTLHSFWLGECAMVGHYSALRLGCRHVISLMGQDALPDNPYRHLVHFSGADIVALTHRQRQALGPRSARVSVIEAGIDADAVDSWHETEREIDVLGVGWLTPLKNYSMFIEIIDALVKLHPTLTAVLLGDGPQRSHIEAEIAARGLGARITLSGSVPRPEVLKTMARSRVFLHTSSYESHGYVFTEAAATGMVGVSFPVGSASPSDYWSVAHTQDGLLKATAAWLASPIQHTQRVPLRMADTVDTYIKRHYL